MRNIWRRGFAATAVVALALAGCAGDEPAEDDTAADTEETEDLDALLDDEQPEMEDPNEDIQDGVYRGLGVVLPVPDGWSLNQDAFAQGVVAAISEDGAQQFSAQAIDTDEAEAAGQPVPDLDTLLDDFRQQIGRDADVDETIELEGAERAHRLTYLDLPPEQEGAAESSATIVFAEGNGRVAQFLFGAASEDYDQSLESVLLEGAGFDADSSPPEIPAMPPPAPEDSGTEGDALEDFG